MGGESLPQFVSGRAEGRAFLIGNEVIDGQVLAARLKPAQQRPDVIVTFHRLNGTEECMFEKPIKRRRGRVAQEIDKPQIRSQPRRLGSFSG